MDDSVCSAIRYHFANELTFISTASLFNVHVKVSDTFVGFEEHNLHGTPCGYVLEVGASHRFICPATVRGRYVKVVIERYYGSVIMSELEVFVEL